MQCSRIGGALGQLQVAICGTGFDSYFRFVEKKREDGHMAVIANAPRGVSAAASPVSWPYCSKCDPIPHLFVTLIMGYSFLLIMPE